METFFVPVKYSKKLKSEIMEECAKIKCDSIGLFSTVQFLEQMNQLETFLKSKGKKVFVGTPNFRAIEKGQVLGCDASSPVSISDKVECYIYVGSGIFHPRFVQLKTKKPVYQLNPSTNVFNFLSDEDLKKYEKIRQIRIAKANNAEKFGIIVCTKSGQCNMDLAREISEKIKNSGKKPYVFLFETIMPE